MSFAKKITNTKNASIYLVTAQEQGKDCWFYVRVAKLKEPLFLAALKTEELTIKDFGETLYSGWGVEADPEVAVLVEGSIEE